MAETGRGRPGWTLFVAGLPAIMAGATAWVRMSVGVLLILASGTAPAHAALVTIATFSNNNGADPYGGLIADAAGNLFGTTLLGGSSGDGTVFEIAKAGSSYGPLTTLVSFNSANGAAPQAGLIADAAGNLFGTTQSGGFAGDGVVIEIAKTGNSYGGVRILSNFGTPVGSVASLAADASGNLFGTQLNGGATNAGTVFEIANTGSTYGFLNTLATFDFTNGGGPYAGLIVDASGNLFGTTEFGGQSGLGTVYEIAKTGGSYGALSTLAAFNTVNGANSYAGLIADGAGNLFGTTKSGGSSGDGTVFEIARTGSTYGPLTTLASFDGIVGIDPTAGLIIDAAGNLFGTTYGYGSNGGSVFELAKTGNTYGSPIQIAAFSGTTGSRPYGGLFADSAGNLLGTTTNGGAAGYGTVFEITGSGYVTSVATVVPEPSGLALLGSAVIGFVLVRRFRCAAGWTAHA